MNTVALYARVSSDTQSKNLTINSQVQEIKERIEQDGYRIEPHLSFVDDGYSGTTLLRPALERMRDCAAEGQFKRLYVHTPDRLARRYALQVLLLEELQNTGVTLCFLQAPPTDSPEQALLVQVQGIIAEYEATRILERSRRGKRHKAKMGSVNPFSRAPYGYLYIRKTETHAARFEIVPEQAAVVREVFEALVYQQQTLTKIAKQLTKRGVPAPRGGAIWGQSTLSKMTCNPAYMGLAAYGKTRAIPRQPNGLRPRRGATTFGKRPSSNQRRPAKEWIQIPVPAVLSEELFQAAQEQLESNRQRAQRNAHKNKYLLRGLVVCSKCGYAYLGRTNRWKTKSGDSRSSLSYMCSGRNSSKFGGTAVCSERSIRGKVLNLSQNL